MDVSHNPPGYAIAYIFIVVFSLAALIFYHPTQPKIVKKYYPTTSERNFEDDKPMVDKKDAKMDTAPQERKVNEKPVQVLNQKESKNAENVVADKDYFEKLSDQYKKETLSKISYPDSRTDMVIRYYKKQKDKNRVYKLKELGYYVHERPSEVTFSQFGSNAIFYGDSISNRDIQLIAYTLIQAGLEIQQISLSKFHDAWKAHSVEIGTDTTISNLPKINLSTLRKNWPVKD